MAPYSLRHTFLIDPDGILRQRWVAVRPSGHAQEVLDVMTDLQNNTSV
jgi:peroxiredoxin Q/BCP